jgi:penicillin-binding protein 1A
MKYFAISIRVILWAIFSLICAMVLISASIYLYLSPSLPDVQTLRDIQLQTPMRVVSADNELIAEFGEQRRNPLSFDEIPPLFVKALIAIEDRHFEDHLGVDPSGFTRAVLAVLTTGETDGPGGSTLTQQVARNFFLTRDKTITRKFTEILLAFQMERELSKQEIFELYANKHFLGYRAYGIQAAADVYYGRDVNDLTLPELAMIAGLHQAPSAANPLINPDRAKRRRDTVLGRMVELDFIPEETYQHAISTPLTAGSKGNGPEIEASYLAEMVRDQMVQEYGEAAYTDGYTVHTTLNTRLQAAANRGLRQALIDYSYRHGYHGPEDRYEVDGLTETEALAQWRELIDRTPRYGGLTPAVVIAATDDALTVMPRSSDPVQIPLERLSWARPYITEDRRGDVPETAAEIAAPGDLVRIMEIDGQWELTQVPWVQGAMVSLDPSDGSVIALVGGFDFLLSKYNRAVQSSRQPGSTFKPFVYAAALDKGFTTASIVNDAPIVRTDSTLEDVWRPRNSGDRYLGPIPLRQALYQSRNLSGIRVLDAIGIDYARNYAERFGFDPGQLPRDMTLVLGSAAASPMQMARGYAVFANGGYLVEPYFIDSITDANGNIIFNANPTVVCKNCPETPRPFELGDTVISTPESADSQGVDIAPITLNLDEDTTVSVADVTTPQRYAPQVMSEQTAYLMDSMLKDVVRRGTGRVAYATMGREDLAGKTGTTNNAVDAWFSGYNGDFVTAAWVGFDDNRGLGQAEYGGKAALPAWITFMQAALDGQSTNSLSQPVGIERIRIDPGTGLLARPNQTGAVFELFKEGTAPTEVSRDDVTIDFSSSSNGNRTDNTSSDEAISPEMLF